MNLPSPALASQAITLMAALMLVVQLLMVVQRMLLTNIRLFAIQSVFLAGIAAVVAYAHHASHVYVVGLLTIAGKVAFLPWLLNRLVHPFDGANLDVRSAYDVHSRMKLACLLVWLEPNTRAVVRDSLRSCASSLPNYLHHISRASPQPTRAPSSLRQSRRLPARR